jgi:hypothetical protein
MIGRALLSGRNTLRQSIKRTKIEYTSGNAYNKRWQWKWPQAYNTSEPIIEPTKVQTPEQFEGPAMFGNWWQDWTRRVIPGIKVAIARRHRMYDNFTLYVLPSFYLFSETFSSVAFGFFVWKCYALSILYVRIRDKTLDPDFKEA